MTRLSLVIGRAETQRQAFLILPPVLFSPSILPSIYPASQPATHLAGIYLDSQTEVHVEKQELENIVSGPR